MAKQNGYVLWQGASLLDGKPIVVIATGFAASSTNVSVKCGHLTYWWQRINGGAWHCYDGCRRVHKALERWKANK